MTNRTWKIIGSIICIIYLVPHIIFYITFKDSDVSNHSSDWANFGTFINGTLAPILAILGVLISYIVYKNNELSNLTSYQNQIMKERPLLFITYSDFDNYLSISLINKGIGALIITDFVIRGKDTNQLYPGIYDVFCNLGLDTDYGIFTSCQKNLILIPKESREILRYECKQYNKKRDFISKKSLIRAHLKDFIIEVSYTDIYNNEMPKYSKDLKMFGRCQ